MCIRDRNYKYQDLAKEGYLKNAIVYRCVNEISKGAGAVDFMLKNDDMMVEEHPLLDLLNRPNPLQSSSEFFNSLFGFLLLSGNAYILKVGSEVGSPRELHLLRPDRIQIKGGGKPIPDRYEYIEHVKIDCEGHDTEVVKSCGDLIDKVAVFTVEDNSASSFLINTGKQYIPLLIILKTMKS